MIETIGDQGGRYLDAHATVPALLREIHTVAAGISEAHDGHYVEAQRIMAMAAKALGIVRMEAL